MATKELVLSCISKSKILKWHVKQGDQVKKDQVLATYIFTEKVTPGNFIVQRKLKAKVMGTMVELSVKPNDEIPKGKVVARLKEEECDHNTIMKEMCCKCGADLRKHAGAPGVLSEPTSAEVPVVHNIHELKVSVPEAQRLAKQDQKQLLKNRKLVLVVDLDMTLIHTTVQPIPKNTEDVYSFTLPDHQYEYHTKLRPNAHTFLENISKFYELHIFTMGSRMYAHTIAKMLDPNGKYFAHRIRSRDEFINAFSKFHDLKALFPCGDHMVCIIDDREDIWNFAPNLIMVKPYRYFKGSDDINDPFKQNSKDGDKNKDSKDSSEVNGDKKDKVNDDENETVHEKDDKNTEKSDSGKDDVKTDDKGKTLLSQQPQQHFSEDKEVKTTSDNSAKNTEDDATTNKNSDVKNSSNGEMPAMHKDKDDYLYYLGNILERIHGSFYNTLDMVKEKGGLAINDSKITKYCTFGTVDPDVRVIAPELKRNTLKGSSIVFTGVIPTNIPLEKSRPWKIAVGLGARVTPDIVYKQSLNSTLPTTHVVAARHGTQKSYKASKSPDIRLVNPNWLWCANERWEWPEEPLFNVPLLDGKNSPAGARQGTPQHSPYEYAQKQCKQISPLAQDGFELPGGYDPDSFLEKVNPLGSFSKNELEAMDKEVEELMQSENEDSSDDDKDSKKQIEKVINSSGPIHGKRKRNSKDESCADENSSMDDETTKKIPKKKNKSDSDNTTEGEENKGDSSSSDSSNDDNSSSSDEEDDDDENSTTSNSSDSSEDSDDENDDEDDEYGANMLERKISESS